MAEKDQQQEAGDKQVEEIRQKKNDYASVFSGEAGKRVLADLEGLCFFRKSTYSPQEGRIFLNEGMRFVVVHIRNMMSMDIDKLRELLKKGEQ